MYNIYKDRHTYIRITTNKPRILYSRGGHMPLCYLWIVLALIYNENKVIISKPNDMDMLYL